MILNRYNNRSACVAGRRPAWSTVRGVVWAISLAAFQLAAADVTVTVEEKKEMARDFINRGDYEGALEAFQAAFELSPSPLLMFNIAMCEKALSRHVQAIRSFQEYFRLQNETRTGNPKLQALAEEALKELYSLVGSLEIVDAPEGATLTIDGTPIGTTPLTGPYYLIPGKHTVTVNKEGFEPMEIEVTVAGGAEIEVRADLQQPLSRIEVACDEPDGVVNIDGEAVGACPYKAELPPGEYEVTVSAPGMKTAEHRVKAEMRRTTIIAVDLEPTAPPVPVASSAAEANPVPPPKPTPPKWMLPTGVSLAVFGAVGVGLGGMFNGKRNESVDQANALAVDIKDADPDLVSTDPDVRDDDAENRSKRNGFIDEAHGYENGAIAGYVVGSTVLLVGAGLVTYYLWARKKGERPSQVDVSVDARGVTIGF